ncbi:unnamed protein product [Caenorhabditis angaria]|uniref:Major sperm protein n=1 Tax=Caenorhabditis angaria TaxID=860376 RepID=A0A9P1N1L0_9PELO|nr:unnamed protein product [Caenorhabditis angaria]
MAAATNEQKNEIFIKNVSEIVEKSINCGSPDHELVIYPRWIVFYSENGYKKPCAAKFFIENRDKFPVVYSIKARQKIFRLGSNNHGILAAGEKQTIKLFLLPCDEWPLGINDYAGKQLKIVVENLKIPANIRPENHADKTEIAKYIWKKSMTEWPMERLYNKISIAIEKSDPVSSSITAPVSEAKTVESKK